MSLGKNDIKEKTMYKRCLIRGTLFCQLREQPLIEIIKIFLFPSDRNLVIGLHSKLVARSSWEAV